VLRLHPLPEAELPVLADEGDRRLGHVLEGVEALAGVREDGLRVFLEEGRDHHGGHAVLHVVEGLQQVAGHQEVDLAGRQHRPVVDHRAALLDVDVEAVLLVGAVHQRLVEAAVAGLRLPVGGEHHFFLRLHGEGGGREGEAEGKAPGQRTDGQGGNAHGSGLLVLNSTGYFHVNARRPCQASTRASSRGS
jgi:hypothetical protein